MEFLYSIDLWLFYFINHNLANPVFDFFFPLITVEKNWFVLYLVLFYFLIFRQGKKGRIAFLMLIITFAISDYINGSVIKELVGRIRPCSTLSDVRLLIPCGAGKSFPSSHAVNTFAAAYVLFTFYREYKYHLFTIASLVAFSRVYVGVHYPVDIIAGTLIGLIMAYFIMQLYKYFDRKKFKVLIKNE